MARIRRGSHACCRGLAGLGLHSGDLVGIWSTNCAEWTLLQYACARAGYVLVNVNPAYRSHELAFILRRSEMRALFLHAGDSRADYQQILDEARSPDQALAHVVHLGTEEWVTMLANGSNLPSEPREKPFRWATLASCAPAGTW